MLLGLLKLYMIFRVEIHKHTDTKNIDLNFQIKTIH
jgi:hypothetical protein